MTRTTHPLAHPDRARVLAGPAILCLALAGACGTVSLPGDPDAGPPMADAPLADAPELGRCSEWIPTTFFEPCDLPPPTGDLVIQALYSPYHLDTSTGTLLDANFQPVDMPSMVIEGPEGPVRALSAEIFMVEPQATVRVYGTMPVIIAAWSQMQVEGTIQAGSELAEDPGPGADPLVCRDSGALPGESSPDVAAGGGGGGFGGPGGTGGATQGRAGGVGGVPVVVPESLRGGCSGADGGDGSGKVGNHGVGGGGGGAILLAALDTLDVHGAVLAGGAGGGGGGAGYGGGGGGGSGGFIVLTARSIIVGGKATLAANGGGGGGGGGGGNPGSPGQSGLPAYVAAAGGAGPGGGGGDGGYLASGGGGAGYGGGGGGGGGGGVGHIAIVSPDVQVVSSAIITPAATTIEP